MATAIAIRIHHSNEMCSRDENKHKKKSRSHDNAIRDAENILT